jgi:uncharacterized protein (TIGR02099 family)
MRKLLRAVEIVAWTVFFAAAIAVLAVRFWLLPDIERYREDIVAAVSQTVGRPVKIGRIEAGWLGINPQVSLYDVRILDAQGREALVLPAVENSIGWRSLVMGELRLHALAIDGPRLDVRRDRAGDLYVAGIRVARAGGAPAEGGLADWVLAQPEIQIRNAEVEWHDDLRGAPALALSAVSLRLRNGIRHHTAGLTARLPPELGNTLEARADLAGGLLGERAGWRGTLYVESGYTDLAGWRPWFDYPIDLKRGQGAVRAWAGVERGELAELTADLQLLDVVPGVAPVAMRLGWKASAGAPQSSFAAKALELEALHALSAVLPLPEKMRARLAALAPRGRLQDVKVDWQGPPEAPAAYAVRARFEGLAMNAVDRLPGFSGLTGSVELTEQRGALTLDARKAGLVLTGLLPEPRLAFDTLAGQLAWERTGERGWSVRIGSLAAANADIDARVSGTYAYTGAGPGAVDITAEVRRADVGLGERYLPHGELMGVKTRGYLVSAVKAGKGHDGRLRLRGDLADFPFRDPAQGEFRITARIDQGIYEPGDGWPRVEQVEAQLLFDRDRMEITARSGVVHGARLSNVKVEIPQLSGPATHLVASGQAEGSLAQYLEFVRASPVSEMTGGLIDGMSGTGRGRLALGIDLPIEARELAKVNGEFAFSAATFEAHPDLPPIERLTGRLGFTESSVTVREGRGRFLGGPLSVSGGSRTGGALEIAARGDAAFTALAPLLPAQWRRHFSGAAPWSAQLSLRNGRGRVSAESSLRGFASSLPPPLAKGAAEALPLRLEVLPGDGGRDRVTVQLGTLARAELLRQREGDATKVHRAAVWLSPQAGQQVRVPERAGVLVYGTLPALDADRWLAALAAEPGSGARDANASSVPGTDLPLSLDLKIGALDLYGRRVSDLALAGSVDAGGWTAKVQATELAGDLAYRREGDGKLVARLSRLAVPKDVAAPGRAPQGLDRSPQGLDNRPRELPAVDLVAEQLVLGARELGRVEVVAVPADGNWRIDKLAVANPDGVLTGKGTWRTGAAPLTSLALDLDAPQPGRLLRRLGYGDVLRGGHVRMQASLTWAGDVTAIDYPSLSGEIQLQAEEGSFVQIDPGVGKLLSVMSLQALPRRLTLDFRDVFSSGFAFDRIRTAAQIDRGTLTLKDFEMDGPAAAVQMSGSVDLARETQALSVRVVPQIGDTASTALLFVNPFLFFPAAIAQRILKDPLGHIFAFNYAITGSWDDPKIERTAVNARPLEPELPSQ